MKEYWSYEALIAAVKYREATYPDLNLKPLHDASNFQSYPSQSQGNMVLSILSVLTAAMCMFRVIRLHIQRSQAYHHFGIFYLATISCVIGGVNWVLGGRAQMHLGLQFLKLLMFLVLSHFYWVLASRALRCEAAVRKIMYPAVACVVAYYTVTACVGMANMRTDANQCMAPYWLLMSAMEVLLVQLFALAAVYITRRLNEISTLDSVRWAQKRDLWCIVFVFEFSAIFTMVYDIVIQIMGDKQSGCGAIFVVKLMVPIWAMLYAFQPGVAGPEREPRLPAYSEEGTYGSAYSDDSQYRQLYHPADMYHSVNSCSVPDISPSPTAADPRFGLSNPALTHSSTSTLEPISEEFPAGGRKNSEGMLAGARNIPKELGKSKCFNWLRTPSPGKFYL
nr:hypothetical protein BaRGS_010064 [Batillaria attramentaria]